MHLLLCTKHHELSFVCSSRRKSDKQCHLHGQALQVVDDTDYFGVTLTLGSDATWESHINVVTSKTSSAGIWDCSERPLKIKAKSVWGTSLQSIYQTTP